MDPALITAWATVAIAASMIVVGGMTCFLIWRGVREMRRSSDERASARETAGAELAEWRDADIRRHEEAMATMRGLHEESRGLHEETMTALRALIERTAPAAPAE